jgi:hypothetical protein
MTLRSVIATDAITVFLNEDDFAEEVVYYPRNGTPRPINAVVIREGVTIYIDDGQNALPGYEVHVANDDTRGISDGELNVGGETISFPPRESRTSKKHTIQSVSSQDNGMLVLVCL